MNELDIERQNIIAKQSFNHPLAMPIAIITEEQWQKLKPILIDLNIYDKLSLNVQQPLHVD